MYRLEYKHLTFADMKGALNLELIIRPIQGGEYNSLQERT